MTNLKELKSKSRIEEQLDSTTFIAKHRVQAIDTLVSAGEPDDRAAALVDKALEREGLTGYEPGSDERITRALAALKTITALYTNPAPATIAVSIAQITIDQKIQVRVNGLDPARVEDYRRAMADGDEFPPIVLYWDGETLWLADGFHRVAAAKPLSSAVTIPAEVRTGSRQCAEEYAATCNAHHGLPMTNADKRAAVERLISIHPKLSDREVARRVGVSHPFVGGVRADLSGNGYQIGDDQRTVTRAGTTYTYTPPEPATYASIWQLENSIRERINVNFGFPGRSDYDPQLGIDYLQAIVDAGYELPGDLVLPDHRKGDLKQAINNVLEQLRQKQSATEDNGDAELAADLPAQDAQTEDLPSQGYAVSRSPTPQPVERHRIRDFLLGENVEALRAQLAVSSWRELDAAIHNIYTHAAFYERDNASQTLYDAILEPWPVAPEPSPEADETMIPTPAQSLDDDHVGCPECGGHVILITAGGESRHVCEDCGAMIDPQIGGMK